MLQCYRRLHPRFCFLQSGKNSQTLVCVGGWDGQMMTEIYNANVNNWMCVEDTIGKRVCAAAAWLDGYLYVTGGRDGIQYVKTAERYNPNVNKWESIKDMTVPHGNHRLVGLDGALYAIGGWDGKVQWQHVERYNVATNSWSMAMKMSVARYGVACCICRVCH
jgi:kelch-like protein 20